MWFYFINNNQLINFTFRFVGGFLCLSIDSSFAHIVLVCVNFFQLYVSFLFNVIYILKLSSFCHAFCFQFSFFKLIFYFNFLCLTLFMLGAFFPLIHLFSHKAHVVLYNFIIFIHFIYFLVSFFSFESGFFLSLQDSFIFPCIANDLLFFFMYCHLSLFLSVITYCAISGKSTFAYYSHNDKWDVFGCSVTCCSLIMSPTFLDLHTNDILLAAFVPQIWKETGKRVYLLIF